MTLILLAKVMIVIAVAATFLKVAALSRGHDSAPRFSAIDVLLFASFALAVSFEWVRS